MSTKKLSLQHVANPQMVTPSSKEENKNQSFPQVVDPRFIIITPARDEEKYIEKTIHSVISQTITPLQWIIVNDGSTDKTGEIIDSYAKDFDWISPVHRQNRGFRKNGSGVMEAFYDGYSKINFDFGYLVKLDSDLSFDNDYFENCFKQFYEIPKLGIGGGVIYNVRNNRQILEKQPSFHVRGATKIYKRDCWKEIGGLIKYTGWDTLDEVKANMLGWKTGSFKSIKLVQHRTTGGADGILKDFYKNGRANYITGYHPIFMAASCVKRLTRTPFVIASMSMFAGYISGYINRTPKVEDRVVVKYMRTQQMNKLLGRESIWN